MKAYLLLIPLVLFSYLGCSCNNPTAAQNPVVAQNPKPGATPVIPPTGAIIFSWSGGGCPISLTLDGGSPIAEVWPTGMVTLYSNIPNGMHTLVIIANGMTTTCPLDINGVNRLVTVTGICTSPTATY